MLQVDPIQSFLNLKIGLPPVLKAGSSGIYNIKVKITILCRDRRRPVTIPSSFRLYYFEHHSLASLERYRTPGDA